MQLLYVSILFVLTFVKYKFTEDLHVNSLQFSLVK